MRCPDCAGTRSSVAANPTRALTAAAAGLALATVVGIGWGYFPDWQFYWALVLGFGVVETMVRFVSKPHGIDLQAIALVIVVYGMLLSRVVLAQRLGISLVDMNDLGPSAQRVLYLRPIPDLLFALLPIVIAWIRFR